MRNPLRRRGSRISSDSTPGSFNGSTTPSTAFLTAGSLNTRYSTVFIVTSPPWTMTVTPPGTGWTASTRFPRRRRSSANTPVASDAPVTPRIARIVLSCSKLCPPTRSAAAPTVTNPTSNEPRLKLPFTSTRTGGSSGYTSSLVRSIISAMLKMAGPRSRALMRPASSAGPAYLRFSCISPCTGWESRIEAETGAGRIAENQEGCQKAAPPRGWPVRLPELPRPPP